MSPRFKSVPAGSNGLSKINHVVVLMLENRSFDHMLGFLYTDQRNTSPLGQPYEGLTGHEQNPDSQGNPVTVFKVGDAVAAKGGNKADLYYYPKSCPGEGFSNTNQQLFGNMKPAANAQADNEGFVTNFAETITWDAANNRGNLPNTLPADIMGMYTPDLLPVLSGLAKGYAVCDHWYASAPTMTMPNRAFALAATSQGRLNDAPGQYTAPTIFSLLSAQKKTWAVYGYEATPLTKDTFSDIASAPAANFGQFSDFQKAVKAANLANFVFLEPSWDSQGNSQHPNYDVAAGEALILQVYNTLFNSPVWEETLLVITYDEHGGCYDHMVPPAAVAPDNLTGEQGFAFNRLGVRVPTVLVSPWIPAGTVYRVTQSDGTPLPFDHTSTLKTVEKRFGLSSLTKRDAAALDVGGVLSLSKARTDNPLQGVQAPVNPNPGRVSSKIISHLQLVHAELLSGIPTSQEAQGASHFEPEVPLFKSGEEVNRYIRKRS